MSVPNVGKAEQKTKTLGKSPQNSIHKFICRTSNESIKCCLYTSYEINGNRIFHKYCIPDIIKMITVKLDNNDSVLNNIQYLIEACFELKDSNDRHKSVYWSVKNPGLSVKKVAVLESISGQVNDIYIL